MSDVSNSNSANILLLHPPPPHNDASWVNSPILLTSGPLRGRWIRAELVVVQQPRRGRKGAIHDLRPLHPPPTVRLRLWEIVHPVPSSSIIPNSSPETLWFHSPPDTPPPTAQAYPIPITPRLTTHFLCFASLFKVHPPTREQEYGRVDRKVMVSLPEGPGGGGEPHYSSPMLQQHQHQHQHQQPGEVTERPKSDKSRLWKSLRPHPMTAISCHDPLWPSALAQARRRFNEEGRLDSPSPLELVDSDPNRDPTKDIEMIDGDIHFRDMVMLESYLPREAPKWVFPYQDVTAHLSKRETAGHLIPSSDNGEPAFYFVFSDLAIRNEGYFSLRFHIVNLDWRVHPQFSRPGNGFFSPLCDCVTTPFAVYSTKEFPGLPPTTEFTAYLVRNGVRIRFRDDRVVDAAVGGEQKGGGRTEGRSRASASSRKNSKTILPPPPAVSSPELKGGLRRTSGDSTVGVGVGVGASGSASSVDSQREALLDAANQLWRQSPGGGVFQRTFDAEEFESGVADISLTSPTSLRHPSRAGRSNTIGTMRVVSSPPPLLQDRRSYSHPTLDHPVLNGSPTIAFSQGSYPLPPLSSSSTPAPRRSIPNVLPPHHHLLTRDLGMRPGEHHHHWSTSSISPQSPHGSIPSPGQQQQQQQQQQAVWLDDDRDMRYAAHAGPSTLNLQQQHSPHTATTTTTTTMRERSHHHHRYFPYPPATATTTTTTTMATTTHAHAQNQNQNQNHPYDHDMQQVSPLGHLPPPPQGSSNDGGYLHSSRSNFNGNS